MTVGDIYLGRIPRPSGVVVVNINGIRFIIEEGLDQGHVGVVIGAVYDQCWGACCSMTVHFNEQGAVAYRYPNENISPWIIGVMRRFAFSNLWKSSIPDCFT